MTAAAAMGVAVMAIGVALCFGVRVLVLVLVPVLVTLIAAGRGRIVRAGQIVPDRFERVGLVRSYRNDPARGHALTEALAERTRDQDVNGIERMGAAAVPIVHGELLGEVEAIDLLWLRARFGFKHQKPARPPRVRGDGAEVLAGDGNSHVSMLLKSKALELSCPCTGAGTEGRPKTKGGEAQRGCLFPAPAPFRGSGPPTSRSTPAGTR